MDRETFMNSIDVLRRRTPFQPFTISLFAGNQLEIDRPEVIAISEGAALFWGPGGRVPWIFDHAAVSHIIDDLAGQPKE